MLATVFLPLHVYDLVHFRVVEFSKPGELYPWSLLDLIDSVFYCQNKFLFSVTVVMALLRVWALSFLPDLLLVPSYLFLNIRRHPSKIIWKSRSLCDKLIA